jgi:SagB-type dehydrogenase family enzyme
MASGTWDRTGVGRRAALRTLLGAAAISACSPRREVARLPTSETAAVSLPSPGGNDAMALRTALQRRRSVREYSGRPLTAHQVSELLWAAQGVTAADGRRTAPSAGARYPLEVYLVDEDGLFHYEVADHALQQLGSEDLRADLRAAALDQESVGDAPAVLVLTGVESRTAERYGDRAPRYVAMEAGHAAQNVHLMAVALGLVSVPIGGFDDRAVADVLGLPSGEAPLYLLPVGQPVG